MQSLKHRSVLYALTLVTAILALVWGWSLQRANQTPQTAPTASMRNAVNAANKPRAAYDDAQPVPVAVLTGWGQRLFFDPSLSASGRLACAGCHDPAQAFSPANALPVQPGGGSMQVLGVRAAPSLRYLHKLPPFSEHFHDEDVDESIDQGPTGGHTWDGRASSAHDQARLPLLSPEEMANADAAAVVDKVAHASYADEFRYWYGDDFFAHVDAAFERIVMALEIFQQDPARFYPYDSKYDAVLRGKARLNAAEARGLALFNDPEKGNCAACHPSAIKADGSFPLFTDQGYIALGVPRNQALPANTDPAYFDLGLCGPLRQDLRDRAEYCGLFRTPTLRNVALRRSFFHNGRLHSLDEVVRFYATRDTRPQDWYAHEKKGIEKFDDLPLVYRANVNTDAPFGGLRGDKPRLNAREIQDIVAFLGSLTDGYVPALPLSSLQR